MAEVRGTISEIQGQGSIYIVRSTGERVLAKPGDQIAEGDTVVASDGAVARVNIQGESAGVVSVERGAAAVFDKVLLNRVTNTADASTPVVVNTPAQPDFLKQLEESVNGGQITTVVDPESPPSTSDDSPLLSNDIQFSSLEPLAQPSGSSVNQPPLSPLSGSRDSGADSPLLVPVSVASQSAFLSNQADIFIPREDVVVPVQPQSQQLDNPPVLPPDPPQAAQFIPFETRDDEISIDEDPPSPGVRISVLDNDAVGQDIGGLTGGNSSDLTIELVASMGNLFLPIPVFAGVLFTAGGGTVVVETDGRLLYKPKANFFGEESFEYRVSNSAGEVDTAKVTVTVNAVNDAPVITLARSSAESVTALASSDGQELSLKHTDLFRNVSDVDGDVLSLVFEVQHGILDFSTLDLASGLDTNVTDTKSSGGSYRLTVEGTASEFNDGWELSYRNDIGASGTDVLSYSFSDGLETLGGTLHTIDLN